MGADYSFYVKIIETQARAFFKVIILSIGSVYCNLLNSYPIINNSFMLVSILSDVESFCEFRIFR